MKKRAFAALLALCLLMSFAHAETADASAAGDGPSLLPAAQWIWADSRANNQWVDFVYHLTLDSDPTEAVAEIAVENSYFLYVNGQKVVYDGGLKRGPNPTDGYFDRVDLTPCLHAGDNLVCIKAWFWGVKGDDAQSYSNVPVDTAGLLFAAKVDGQLYVSGADWAAQVDGAFLDDTALGVPQPNLRFPEYNIYYDAALTADAGWLSDPAVSENWPKAQVRGSYGDAPWNALHLRPIPLLWAGELTDYPDSAAWAGVTLDEDTDITLRLPYNAQFAPYLSITTDAPAVVTITTENTVSCESVYTTFVSSGTGEDSFESPGWISGQYVTYHIPAGVTVNRLAWRESGYATALAGSFSMENAFFDTLWQMGARTQYLCIRENFMDCPDRERAQWTGDATSQMRQMMYCLTPSTQALYTKLMAQKAAWVTPGSGKGKLDNLLPTVMPIWNEFYELPAQEMAGIVGLWDDYLYTGDTTALETMYPYCVAYLQRWKLAGTGLVKHKTGQGLVDWQDTGSNQVDTKPQENAWYYWALHTTQKMGQLLGEDTTWVEETMAKVAAGYETLWVEGSGYAVNGAPDDRANALAVLSGLAPESRWETIAQVLTGTQRASSYMEAYVLQALCHMGYVSEALDRMEQRFGDMVAINEEKGYTTLWEYFTEGQGTWNHAWSASPVFLLSAYVGGVRPTSAGYETCVIAPDFSHSDTVSVSVETVKGTIAAAGTAEALTVTLPEGVTATVILSGTQQVLTTAGEHLVTAE